MGFMMPSIPSIPVPEVITLQFVPWLHGLMVSSTTKTVGFWLDPGVFLLDHLGVLTGKTKNPRVDDVDEENLVVCPKKQW